MAEAAAGRCNLATATSVPTKEKLLWMFETMQTIRRFEEQAKREADAGRLRGMHSSIGQEAVPTGVCAHLTDDDFVLGTRMIVDDVAEEGDPVGNLAQAFLHAHTATASVYIGEERKGQALVEKCRARDAEGIIFCAASFCDPALLDQPMLIRAVEAEGIPFTEFKFSENTSQFQVVKEQTGTFSDSLKLWGEA